MNCDLWPLQSCIYFFLVPFNLMIIRFLSLNRIKLLVQISKSCFFCLEHSSIISVIEEEARAVHHKVNDNQLNFPKSNTYIFVFKHDSSSVLFPRSNMTLECYPRNEDRKINNFKIREKEWGTSTRN